MAASVRGCSARSLRIRGRNDSGEENVPLDLSRDPADNLREILQNVAKPQGVSNMRKLGHLNNFIKLLCNIGHCEEKLGFTYEEIIICLRLALLNEAKEVRAAGLRALRYLTRDSSILQKVLKLRVDYLIARCIDIQQSNEVERTQALRLVRKMITVNAALFPNSITNSLIAVGNDGLQERDRMVRACLAILCELALQNPEVVAIRGGLSTILKNVIDCQLNRINEALITTILHLLNHPKTRKYIRNDVELEQILAPYTDFHYRHNPDTAEGQLKEDREARLLASKMAIVAAFRSWAGIINLCRPGNSGIHSLIGILCIPNMEVRRGLLEVLHDIFRLPIPVDTQDFSEALLSVDPSRFQDSWRLSDGFVAAEAKTILPHRARSRPDLMDNYLALVLSAFINNGLLESLVEVLTSSNDGVFVCATILLGELLHMANNILPYAYSHHLHCLPTLMNMAASFNISQEKRLRASAAVNCLKRFHEMKKRGSKPYSLYLDHIAHKSGSNIQKRDQHLRIQKDFFVLKDTEEAMMGNLRDSDVLNNKDNLRWNWNLISTILKWPNVNLRNYKDEQLHRFVRRLLYFYKPSGRLYANMELDHAMGKQLTIVGCQFIEFLLESSEDGQIYLEELVKDIVQWLSSSSGLKPERSLQNNGLLNTLSQHYFLLIGTLSAHPHGVKMLEKCSMFQCLLSLCSLKNYDHVLKLTVSTLDYSRDGLSRVILSKILTSATDNCRLYATKHLRVLLRANVEFFSNWGMELLVTQLHDKNKAISLEALEILDEACEDKANLHALIQLKPALTHLGDKGLLLLLRFLSIPKGFSYLNERGYVTKQLEKWQQEYNLKYVDLIEEKLNEALTTYRKPADGENYVRRSNQRLQRLYVYLPIHLYSQLVHHKTGCHLLETQSIVPDLSYVVRSPALDKWDGVKQLKAALWALGNIGSSNWGLNLLQEENVIPDIIVLAQTCETLSVRGTCLYVLGLLAKTKQGCDILKQHNWDAVRHSRRQPWPVAPDDMEQLYSELSSVPSTLSLSSESTGSRHNSDSESLPQSMFIMEDDRYGSSTTSTFFLDITEEGDPSLLLKPKSMKEKERSPLSILSSSKFVTRRFFNNLTSLPSKKLRSSSESKSAKVAVERKHVHQRIRAVTEPANSTEYLQSEVFTSIFNGTRMHKSHTLSLETSFVGNRDHGNGGSSHSISETELKRPKTLLVDNHREQIVKDRSMGDGTAGPQFKSRSQSFNTDTTTSGISSMSSVSSSPSSETVRLDLANADTDCGSLNTIVSSRTLKTNVSPTPRSNHLPLSKSNSVSLVPPGSSHTLPRRAQSLKAPSVTTIKSLTDYSFSYTSPRDAFGYATLKRLQQQRMHSSLSHSEALASPAKDVLFTDTITMKTGSLDSRLTPRRFIKALSFASLDKEDLLSPINHTTLQRSSSVRSMVSNATYGSNDDYIGLALPSDINELFQVKDIPYFQQKCSPPEDDYSMQGPESKDDQVSSPCSRSPFQELRSQISFTEAMLKASEDAPSGDATEETGLQEHTDDSCLYCVCLKILGCQPSSQCASTLNRADLPDVLYSDCCLPTIPIHTHLEVTPRSSKISGISGCSDAVSQGSASSTKSVDILITGKAVMDNKPACRVLLRKEVLRLVINLSSSVGTKGHETGLLTIKEKFPHAFDDICLYSEVSHLLANCTFRLPSRRFIQELFQDVQFQPLYEEADTTLVLPKPVDVELMLES
ncbi:rapamycin-insensitive companion of mTOR isoform X1 [Leucoraja erinacea]|uniref:rapamycin-insensitive companion of mTOR isoform X1 n=1 Tax=Leucoraja erinaceus TaxID=7782 RepID=UPI0024557E86|nr:rapamycin-insensitive companion of mTOR isoform X1 [Leucoraja erinacea]